MVIDCWLCGFTVIANHCQLPVVELIELAILNFENVFTKIDIKKYNSSSLLL